MKRLVLCSVVLVGLTACASSAAADHHPRHVPSPEDSTPSPTARATPRPTATPEPTPVFGEAPTGPTQLGTVVGVTDGDTIKVDVDGVVYDVRYIGVSTPEIHGELQWLGPEASAANSALVAGKTVLLETDVSETDQYGRLLRHVWVEDGTGWLLVNLELVRLGFAQVTTYPPDVKYIDELYVPAQASAQTAVLGLWARSRPQCRLRSRSPHPSCRSPHRSHLPRTAILLIRACASRSVQRISTVARSPPGDSRSCGLSRIPILMASTAIKTASAASPEPTPDPRRLEGSNAKNTLWAEWTMMPPSMLPLRA